MPVKPRLASHLLSLTALLLVLAVGVVFEALLARELLKRQQRWSVHHPAMDMQLRRRDQDVAPPRPRRMPYHGQRAPLTAGGAGPIGGPLA